MGETGEADNMNCHHLLWRQSSGFRSVSETERSCWAQLVRRVLQCSAELFRNGSGVQMRARVGRCRTHLFPAEESMMRHGRRHSLSRIEVRAKKKKR